MPDRYPIVHPTTGEVLATDDDDRREAARLLAEQLVAATRDRLDAQRREDVAREALVQLLDVGDALAVDADWSVTVKPPASPKRQVNRQAVQQHAEALRPADLHPRQPDKVPLVFPTVAQLTSAKAREALARQGLTPEQFLLDGDQGDPQLVVYGPGDL